MPDDLQELLAKNGHADIIEAHNNEFNKNKTQLGSQAQKRKTEDPTPTESLVHLIPQPEGADFTMEALRSKYEKVHTVTTTTFKLHIIAAQECCPCSLSHVAALLCARAVHRACVLVAWLVARLVCLVGC